MDINIKYYNKVSKEFIEETMNCDMSVQYNLFLKYISNNATILDLGFGSGRDMLYFKQLGYNVIGIDPTIKFVELAKELGLEVYKESAQDMTFDNMFDGIWACASLLHVPTKDLKDVFNKCHKALKDNGYLYASFKYGEYEGERKGRVFTDMTEDKLNEYITITSFKVIEYTITKDVRKDKDELWLNVILRKE